MDRCIVHIQKGRRDDYTLFLSDESVYTVDEASLVTHGLHRGMMITEELSSLLSDCQTLSRARKLALSFLQTKSRTSKEIQEKLKRHEISRCYRDKIVEELTAKGYLNDAQYARDWVEYKVRVKGLGSKRLYQELQQKGIESPDIEEALSQLNSHQEIACAVQQAEKRYTRISGEPWDKVQRKISAYLMRKGYSVEVIYKAIASLKERGD